jgi:hypothetical protein
MHMPRYDVGLRRIVSLSTAIVVEAETEEEAKALAAQRALDGALTWEIQDNNAWQADEEIEVDWIEEA